MEDEDNENLEVVNQDDTTDDAETTATENTDTTSAEENVDTSNEENKDLKVESKSLKNLMKEHPEYQKEMNTWMKNRIDREKNKVKRDFAPLVNVLKAGTGKEDINDITKSLEEFYESQGVKINKSYDEYDTQLLAKAKAKLIIDEGYDSILEATNDLIKNKDKMSAEDKIIFMQLADERKKIESIKELKSIGVKDEVLNNEDFINFTKKFNSNVSIRDIYEMYKKTIPQKEVAKPIGSMKSTTSGKEAIKEQYSKEEAEKYTREELDKNPKLFQAILKSMPSWK